MEQAVLRGTPMSTKPWSLARVTRLAGLAVPVTVEQPVRLAYDFPLGAQAGVGEVAIRVAHHSLGPVVAVLDGDVHCHVRCLSHELSVSQHPVRAQWPAATLHFQASATAAMPASNLISGTSVRRIPSTSKESTISMPNAFCPAATGTTAKDL
jgi:hypothetical protein